MGSGSFKVHGIRYTTSTLSRSELYLEALPALMGGQFVLLDDPRLIAQIGNLERRTSRVGEIRWITCVAPPTI